VTILQLAANRWWTGSADSIVTLCRGLRERGHRVMLAMIRGDRFEAKAREAGIEPLTAVALERSPVGIVQDVLALRRLIGDEGVELVHAHHSHDHWLAGVARSRAALVRTFHNARGVRTGVPSAWLYGRTAGSIAVSAAIEARCLGAGLPRARLWRVPGVTDVARFAGPRDGRAIREEFKVGGTPLVGCVARLAPRRGHAALIAGFQELVRQLPETRLLLVGKGESRSALEADVATQGLANRVLFAGYRDRDLPGILAALDCFVLMAAGSDESCRAVLEAMAAGCPVVAPRVGALPETIVDGETGLLLDDDRPETIARALAAVLRDPGRARAMGAAGQRRAQTEFTPARYVDAVERIYRTVLDRV
jgi:glycosyltransferase involved in cell wall biosynthesis